MSKRRIEIMITARIVEIDEKGQQKDVGKPYHSLFNATREELDQKGILAYKSLDGVEYVTQELKREYDKPNK